jgi:hypothetical protein
VDSNTQSPILTAFPGADLQNEHKLPDLQPNGTFACGTTEVFAENKASMDLWPLKS